MCVVFDGLGDDVHESLDESMIVSMAVVCVTVLMTCRVPRGIHGGHDHCDVLDANEILLAQTILRTILPIVAEPNQ